MKIPIKQIASRLGIRPVRTREKAVQLNLLVDEDDQLCAEDVQVLVKSYQESNRVSERTRRLAAEFFEEPNGTRIEKAKKIAKPNRKPKKKKEIKNAINTLISGLLSKEFKFVALLVAITVQMQHSAAWFYRLSSNNVQEGSWVTAYGYAFMVDLFILVITFEGRKQVAKTFAVLTFFANVLYFQFWVGCQNNIQGLTNAVSCIMVSGIIAYIIYAYTEIFFQVRN